MKTIDTTPQFCNPIRSHRSRDIMPYLRYLCLSAYCGVQHILCCVFCFVFLRLVDHMLKVSLDYPVLIAPSVFSNFLLIPLLHICITAHSPGFLVTPINISGLKLMIQPNLPCWCRWRIHNVFSCMEKVILSSKSTRYHSQLIVLYIFSVVLIHLKCPVYYEVQYYFLIKSCWVRKFITLVLLYLITFMYIHL